MISSSHKSLSTIDISAELIFKTARSGGKGGQNVNKVETMVEGRWLVMGSGLVSDEQKQLIVAQLSNRITSEGYLLVKSQADRTQQGNKELVIRKMNELVNKALVKKKPRIAVKPSAAMKAKRLEQKRLQSRIKQDRQKWRPDE